MLFISNTKERNHKDVICELLEWSTKCVLCTSYLDGRGFECISSAIVSGIENRGLDIVIYSNGEKKYTKACAIEAMSSVRGLTHKIINGKRRLHAKIFYFEKDNEFFALVGSANLTRNGLTKNIEFSVKFSGKIGSQMHKEIFDNLNKLEKEC